MRTELEFPDGTTCRPGDGIPPLKITTHTVFFRRDQRNEVIVGVNEEMKTLSTKHDEKPLLKPSGRPRVNPLAPEAAINIR